jgi:cellulose synthase/poly-beta-1,6-N-acetylglucosamine synthase-like glycosyltransferase
MDWELNTCVGAAGELFAIRTKLFNHVPEDTILDDFFISLKIVMQGYKIAYEPNSYAEEFGSTNIQEEIKRKIRISAGGLQCIVRLSSLLNPFKYGWLSFQYISHKVLRWTLGPAAIFLLVPINLYLLYLYGGLFYELMLGCQLLFYVLASIGYLFEKNNTKLKVFYVPYYFLMINYCVLLGFLRVIRGEQKATWERSKRM